MCGAEGRLNSLSHRSKQTQRTAADRQKYGARERIGEVIVRSDSVQRPEVRRIRAEPGGAHGGSRFVGLVGKEYARCAADHDPFCQLVSEPYAWRKVVVVGVHLSPRIAIYTAENQSTLETRNPARAGE